MPHIVEDSFAIDYRSNLYKKSMQTPINGTWDHRRKQAYDLQAQAFSEHWWQARLAIAERFRGEGRKPVHRTMATNIMENLSEVPSSYGGILILHTHEPALLLHDYRLELVAGIWRRLMDEDDTVWAVLEEAHPGVMDLYDYGMVNLSIWAVHSPRSVMCLGSTSGDVDVPSEAAIKRWIGR